MTRVRIIVEDPLLGDVQVEQDDRVGSWSEDRQRRAVQQLMSQAITKINNAYQLGATTRENPYD